MIDITPKRSTTTKWCFVTVRLYRTIEHNVMRYLKCTVVYSFKDLFVEECCFLTFEWISHQDEAVSKALVIEVAYIH